ncbi:MAG: hypothetical protein LC775_11275 [Acidobacteria bacterium]|nr:hypothetical protein [Acidobacteriota bacterium]
MLLDILKQLFLGRCLGMLQRLCGMSAGRRIANSCAAELGHRIPRWISGVAGLAIPASRETTHHWPKSLEIIHLMW